MILAVGESFLPAIMAGGLVTLILLRSAPRELWMLPGLWQIFYGLGIFASCRFVPRQMLAVGAWFLGDRRAVPDHGTGAHALSAWEMGFPFGIGQLLIAAILKFRLYGDGRRCVAGSRLGRALFMMPWTASFTSARA